MIKHQKGSTTEASLLNARVCITGVVAMLRIHREEKWKSGMQVNSFLHLTLSTSESRQRMEKEMFHHLYNLFFQRKRSCIGCINWLTDLPVAA